MRGIAFITLLMIVFVVIIGALLTNIIFSSQGTLEGGVIERILEGAQIPVPIESDPVGTLELAQPPTPDDQVTSTQIACDIALALRDDFGEYGYDGVNAEKQERAGERVQFGKENDYIIIASGQFKINKKTDGSFYSYNDLSDDGKKVLQEKCSDSKDDKDDKGDVVGFFQCATPYLDEKCATGILANLQIGEKPICTREGDVIVGGKAGEANVKFGNTECVEANKGKGDCSTLCPATGKKEFDDKLSWKAAAGLQAEGNIALGLWYFTNDRDLFVSDEVNEKGKRAWPPSQCDDVNYPISGVCNPKEQTYAWFLVWNKNKQGYEIYVPRLATEESLGVTDFNALPQKLISHPEGSSLNVLGSDTTPQPYKKYFRSLLTGSKKPELRTVYQVKTQPENDVLLSDFLAEVEKEMGKEWTVPIAARCADEFSCENHPIRDTNEKSGNLLKWKYIPEHGGSTSLGHQDYQEHDEAKTHKERRESLKVLRVFTNVPEGQENLLATHTYRIELRFWSSTRYRGPINPAGADVACFEPDGVIRIRLLGECTVSHDGHGHAEYYEVTRIDDNSLIIIDEGEVSPS